MLDLQIVGLDIGIIGHRLGIDRAFQLQRAATLRGCHIGRIACAVCLDVALQCDAFRDAHTTHRLRRHHLRDEADVVGLCIEVEVGFQTVRTVEIGNGS